MALVEEVIRAPSGEEAALADLGHGLGAGDRAPKVSPEPSEALGPDLQGKRLGRRVGSALGPQALGARDLDHPCRWPQHGADCSREPLVSLEIPAPLGVAPFLEASWLRPRQRDHGMPGVDGDNDAVARLAGGGGPGCSRDGGTTAEAEERQSDDEPEGRRSYSRIRSARPSSRARHGAGSSASESSRPRAQAK